MGTTEKYNRLVDGFLVSKLADEKFLKDISKGMKWEEILEKILPNNNQTVEIF